MPTPSVPWSGSNKYGTIWLGGFRRYTEAELSVPPTPVTDFNTRFDGLTPVLTWTPVEDFRPVSYELRKGDTWESGTVLGEVQQSGTLDFPTSGSGLYWIKSKVSLQGITNYSAETDSLLISAQTFIGEWRYDRSDTNQWNGTLIPDAVIREKQLTLFYPYSITESTDLLADSDILWPYSVATFGAHESAAYKRIDLGKEVAARISYDSQFYTYSLKASDIISMADILSESDILGGSASSAPASVAIKYRQAGNNQNFTPWLTFPQAQLVTFRYMDVRVELATTQVDIIPQVTRFNWQARVASVFEKFQDFTVSQLGTYVAYSASSGTIARKLIVILDATRNTTFDLVNDSVAGFTLRIRESGVARAGTANIIIERN